MNSKGNYCVFESFKLFKYTNYLSINNSNYVVKLYNLFNIKNCSILEQIKIFQFLNLSECY